MRRIQFLLILLALTVVAGCKITSSECTSNAQCGAGRACVGGKCEAVGCTTNEECGGGGMVCDVDAGGVCVAGDAGSASDGGAADSGTDAGVGADGGVDAGCLTSDGGPLALGGTCNQACDCSTGVCETAPLNGVRYCSQPCADAGVCGVNGFCCDHPQGLGGTTINRCFPTGTCGTSCARADDCSFGYVCQNGVCVAPLGGAVGALCGNGLTPCNSGQGLLCFTDFGKNVNYCTKTCCAQTDLGCPDSFCCRAKALGDGDAGAVCVPPQDCSIDCTSDSDCKDGGAVDTTRFCHTLRGRCAQKGTLGGGVGASCSGPGDCNPSVTDDCAIPQGGASAYCAKRCTTPNVCDGGTCCLPVANLLTTGESFEFTVPPATALLGVGKTSCRQSATNACGATSSVVLCDPALAPECLCDTNDAGTIYDINNPGSVTLCGAAAPAGSFFCTKNCAQRSDCTQDAGPGGMCCQTIQGYGSLSTDKRCRLQTHCKLSGYQYPCDEAVDCDPSSPLCYQPSGQSAKHCTRACTGQGGCEMGECCVAFDGGAQKYCQTGLDCPAPTPAGDPCAKDEECNLLGSEACVRSLVTLDASVCAKPCGAEFQPCETGTGCRGTTNVGGVYGDGGVNGGFCLSSAHIPLVSALGGICPHGNSDCLDAGGLSCRTVDPLGATRYASPNKYARVCTKTCAAANDCGGDAGEYCCKDIDGLGDAGQFTCVPNRLGLCGFVPDGGSFTVRDGGVFGDLCPSGIGQCSTCPTNIFDGGCDADAGIAICLADLVVDGGHRNVCSLQFPDYYCGGSGSGDQKCPEGWACAKTFDAGTYRCVPPQMQLVPEDGGVCNQPVASDGDGGFYTPYQIAVVDSYCHAVDAGVGTQCFGNAMCSTGFCLAIDARFGIAFCSKGCVKESDCPTGMCCDRAPNDDAGVLSCLPIGPAGLCLTE
ncbi:MAG: hypothetical protein HYY84_12795 [Deltaproteobacteria bacterium]|nr:hypothetical protein [Deltaproteobacteria bacterium]